MSEHVILGSGWKLVGRADDVHDLVLQNGEGGRYACQQVQIGVLRDLARGCALRKVRQSGVEVFNEWGDGQFGMRVGEGMFAVWYESWTLMVSVDGYPGGRYVEFGHRPSEE